MRSIRFGDPTWASRLRESGVTDVDSILALPAVAPPVARSRTSRTEVVEVGPNRFHRKVYRHPDPGDVLRGLLRGVVLGTPRALREWRALVALRADGFPAAEPVALALVRRFGVLRTSVLLTRTIEGCRPLDRAIHDTGDDGERERLADLVARLLARVHDAAHVLGRPALRDLLLVADGDGLALVDLPRHRRVRRVSMAHAVRDWSRIAVGLERSLSPDGWRRTLRTYASRRDATMPEPVVLEEAIRRDGLRHAERESARSCK